MEDSTAVMEDLKNFFAQHFGRNCDFVVKMPGRVNLIGEHIDYNGYPVLPIAIEQSIFAAVSTNQDSKLHFANINSKYLPFSCSVNEVSNISKPPSWHDYLLSGVLGLQKELKLDQLKGMNIAVCGKIPSAAGLSSSSALVCAAAVATLVSQTSSCTNGGNLISPDSLSMSFEKLAQVCAAAEKYVGTEGGGMDQAACLLSQKDCAQLISFNPLKCEPVTLPDGANFVVANSLQSINKAATSDFNCRVMECRLACHILSKTSGLDWEEVSTLSELQRKLNKSFDEMIELVKKVLHAEPYSEEEIARALYISSYNLKMNILSDNTRHITQFKLRQRALHVFSEAKRVYAFRNICADWKKQEDSGSQSSDGSDVVLRKLGSLMFEAHESARDDYECSHEALDRLVEMSREHSYGARLTGAGWGGCTVALVPESGLRQHCSRLRTNFYDQLGDLGGDSINLALFASPPAAGASIMAANNGA